MMKRICIKMSYLVCALTMLLGIGVSTVNAQESEDYNPLMDIDWIAGPCDAQLGDLATLSIPEGYVFCGENGTSKFLEITQNIPSGDELGVIVSKNSDWFVIFEFENSGYVKDDEKDSIDPDAILDSIRQGTEEANEIRESKGWAPYHIVGWQRQPYYDSITNNLTWSIRGQSENVENINHCVRLLGRRGVMHADLVGDPVDVVSGIKEFDYILESFNFNPGHRYSEFRQGDKIAKYGLTALIAGGVGAIAAKTGLLAKFWKIIVVIFIAIGGAISRFFRKIFGKGVEKTPEYPKQE